MRIEKYLPYLLLLVPLIIVLAVLVKRLLPPPVEAVAPPPAPPYHNPYDVEGNWYKGNMHCHTTNSDGDSSPSAVVTKYRDELGYDFLCISDHNYVTDISAYNNPPAFVTFNGEEVSPTYDPSPVERKHQGAVDIATLIDHIPPPQDIINAILAQDGICILNHAGVWDGNEDWLESTILPLKGFHGLENFIRFDFVWRNVLKPIVVRNDDMHILATQAGKAWTMVLAPSNTPEEIKKAILNGACYGTSAPLISAIKLEGMVITIECSAVNRIRFFGKGVVVLKEITGTGITSGSYQLDGTEEYVRIEITDAAGKNAGSNAIYKV